MLVRGRERLVNSPCGPYNQGFKEEIDLHSPMRGELPRS
jgi:hypothetical protein